VTREISMHICIFLLILQLVACGGESALVRAIRDNDRQRVEALLSDGANLNSSIDKEDRTPLLIAGFYGNPEIIELLISRGSVISHTDIYGRNALHYAARAGSCPNIRALVRGGMAVNGSGKIDEYTPLMEAAWAAKVESIRCLIELGADKNASDGSGFTALMQAVWSRNVDSVQLLVDTGADLSHRNNHGETALDIAIGIKQDEIARILEQK
jgi:uncharacterized protein